MKMLVLAGVVAAILGGGCGESGGESGDTMVGTGSSEDSSGSPAPSTSAVDSGPQDHGHTECEIGAPPECLLVGDDGICTDVLSPAECVDGAWACPRGSVEIRACPPDTGSTGAESTGGSESGSSSDTGSSSDIGSSSDTGAGSSTTAG